jgi:hypothetical protein
MSPNELKLLPSARKQVVADFLYEDIIILFGVPK